MKQNIEKKNCSCYGIIKVCGFRVNHHLNLSLMASLGQFIFHVFPAVCLSLMASPGQCCSEDHLKKCAIVFWMVLALLRLKHNNYKSQGVL